MINRYAKSRIEEALADTRVVFLAGPRQAGKTTLARAFSKEDMPFYSLDDATTRQAVLEDTVGFVRGLDRAVIDEIQRMPEMLLAIKMQVDENPSPGRFLLTGSANIMTIPTVADSLAGRMEKVRLLPLSQAEIRGGTSNFVDSLFAGEVPALGKLVMGEELIETVLSGGYPEALERTQWVRKRNWCNEYVEALVERDVKDVAQVEHLDVMPRLLSALAQHAGQLINYSSVGSALDLNHVTTRKYVGVFESLYLIETLQPWFTNGLKRLVKSPKLHFLDSGLLAALLGVSPDGIASNKSSFGHILETFVFGELRKIASWSDQRCSFYHLRDKQKNEVDVILENGRSEIVGIEVKASASVDASDFSGLRKLADDSAERFVGGVVLYDNDKIVPFGDNMAAVPISCLWG